MQTERCVEKRGVTDKCERGAEEGRKRLTGGMDGWMERGGKCERVALQVHIGELG